MKKFVCFILLICLLGGCALAEAVSFAPLQFQFWGDSTQGYEWSCGYQDNGVLSAPVESYAAAANGLGGEFIFSFEVLSPGRAHIAFNYGPSDGLSLPSQTALYTVSVGEDGSRDLFCAQRYSDDRSVEITLPAPPAGFEWHCVSEDNAMVRLVSQTSGNNGEGEVATRLLYVLEQPGATVLRFECVDPWNPQADAQLRYALDLTVNAEMEISMAVLDD